MSKAEILSALSKLKPEDRRDVLDYLSTLEEKDLLDRELEDFQTNPDAGSPWSEVAARLSGDPQR